jgi:hypothetical protein
MRTPMLVKLQAFDLKSIIRGSGNILTWTKVTVSVQIHQSMRWQLQGATIPCLEYIASELWARFMAVLNRDPICPM